MSKINFNFLLLLLILSGCVKTTKINVKALTRESIDKKYDLCILKVSDKNFDSKTIENKENINGIKLVLTNNSIKIVDDIKKANCVIYVDFGISNPQITTYHESVPVYKYNNHPSLKHHETINSLPNNHNNSKYEIIGYKNVSRTSVMYTKYINLDARIIDTNEQLWYVNVIYLLKKK